jgi:hypothetical protein
MQTIRTRYHGPSNAKGSRYSAECEGGRIYVPANYALDAAENHKAAAQALLTKMRWPGEYAGGCFGEDYYWSPVIRDNAWSTVVNADALGVARSEKKVDRKTAAEVEALRSALGNIEQALGLGHLRTDRGAA